MAAELRSNNVNGEKFGSVPLSWPYPYELEFGGKKWWYTGSTNANGDPIYVDVEEKVAW